MYVHNIPQLKIYEDIKKEHICIWFPKRTAVWLIDKNEIFGKLKPKGSSHKLKKKNSQPFVTVTCLKGHSLRIVYEYDAFSCVCFIISKL